VWHEKELSLLKAMTAKHRSKFSALSSVMVTAAGWLKNCLGGYKQTNEQIFVWSSLPVPKTNALQ
jgi:hypothetical protein